ncbi:MAG TPA: 50S ribosomal protein L18e [Candidatus Thermoplasmatota archaeon]|jgi:large subunit ribosomal protein L18e|nr:50S ribosomal protein L18e [Candidatus Thermoplasmatota archaeon]
MPHSNVATKTNPALVALIHDLKKRALEQQAPVWRDVAVRLAKPTRQHAAVNLSRLERNLAQGETALVPGKVLAAGAITKPVTIAAWAFSEGARAKVQEAGGHCLTIPELAAKNPKGSKVRIIG